MDESGDHRGSMSEELNEVRKQRARKNHRGWHTYNWRGNYTETREFPGCTAQTTDVGSLINLLRL